MENCKSLYVLHWIKWLPNDMIVDSQNVGFKLPDDIEDTHPFEDEKYIDCEMDVSEFTVFEFHDKYGMLTEKCMEHVNFVLKNMRERDPYKYEKIHKMYKESNNYEINPCIEVVIGVSLYFENELYYTIPMIVKLFIEPEFSSEEDMTLTDLVSNVTIN